MCPTAPPSRPATCWWNFDLDAIKAKGYNPVTPVVVTNIDEYIRAIGMAKSGETVEHGSCLLTIV